MVQLQDLPIELLSHCLSFIQWPDPDQARHNLMNISLVSRKFQDLAQPLLFRELEDFDLDGNMGRFILFLKAVIVRPQLGKYVHDVALHPAETDTLEESVKDLPSQDIDLFRSALQEDALLWDMNAGVSSLLLALLLTKTPNLRVLYLCGTVFSIRPLNPIFARDPSFLSSLEELHIKGDEGNPDYKIATFHGLLTRPHLKFINADNGQLLGNNILTPWAPNTLAVKEFCLRQCHVNYNSLKQLIQACKKLTHFTFANWRADPDLLDDRGRRLTPDFDEVDLLEALLPHQDTLEKLDIEFLEGRDPARVLPFAKSPGGKMPSLRNFTVLDHLTIQLGLLPAHPEFPSALKRLFIRECHRPIWDITSCIATDCKNGRYPELEEVKFLSDDIMELIETEAEELPEGQTPEQCFLSLRNLFKGTKVNCQILPYPEEEDDFLEDDSPEDGFPEDDLSEYGFSDEYGTEGSVDSDDGIDQFI